MLEARLPPATTIHHPGVSWYLQVKRQVQETLIKTIDRGRNNAALASRLQQLIGRFHRS